MTQLDFPLALSLSGVSSGYNGGRALHAVSLEVAEGSVHAIVGHNGAGKTTLMSTVAGELAVAEGRIWFDGKDISRTAPHRRAKRGIGYVPQGRRVFKSITVAEHLAIAHRDRKSEWNPARVIDLFPRLGERMKHKGAQLSGGEQQMLAIARALLTSPRLLLLDEPTEGLAPAIVEQIRGTLGKLAAEGMTILLAAPQPEWPIAIADHISVLSAGKLTASIPGSEARDDASSLLEALTITAGSKPEEEPGG
ncbi:ABC transporter ATP-binding protein [Stackebrandtia nassauensis]|uniref:ABC transporter related protein n=1 Tax=Stackebrandtia nassauensis (strain DSM 44728 / CIP 108903 / NRRL B-16338 / NBRC 102104 / LLR-40K-21) TaxID=446470 RepID=D3Q8F1_STANL|nr:ABC transporter ATP-binding protein [Stackebrandtia nassauensis]ADD42525.1 ABC transporter related protein [Stackebrandtia nassauensis DSM 44728]